MFKKILVLLLALIVSFSFVACFSNDDTKEKDNGGNSQQVEKVEDKYIVYNGDSDYVIAIPTKYSETEYFAATEIQNFFNQSTGVKIPIKVDIAIADDNSNKVISIGKTTFFTKKGIKTNYSNFKGDAFIIKTEGNSIFVKGYNDRGTLYGCYELLDKLLGVKFLSSDYTSVPKNTIVNMFSFDYVDAPAFNIRMFLTGDMYTDPLYLARMRMGGELCKTEEKYGGKIQWDTTMPHTTLYYVPTSEYFHYVSDEGISKPKEEYAHMYFAINETQGYWDICMTDGIADDGTVDDSLDVSAFKCALEKLKENVKKSPKDCTYFIFSQMDDTFGTYGCKCARCMAAVNKYKRSGINVRFANLLAEKINEWSQNEYDKREINLVIFAYQYTLDAPVDDSGKVLDASCIPNEHVFVRFAAIGCDQYYSFTDDTVTNDTAVQLSYWRTLTSNIMTWTYHTNYVEFLWPFPTIQTFNENLNLFKEYGAEYVLLQANYKNTHDWQDRMNTYVASKLLWDPSKNAMDVREEFVNLYYGVAANEVMDFIGRLEDKMYEVSLAGGNVGLLYTKEVYNPEFYPITFLETLEQIIDSAIAKVNNSNVEDKADLIRRLKEIKLTPMYMIVYNCDYYYIGDTVKQAEVVKEFCDLCDEVGIGTFSEGGGTANTLRSKYGIS